MGRKIILLLIGAFLVFFISFSIAYNHFSKPITGHAVMYSATSNGTELYVDAAPTDWGCTVRSSSSGPSTGGIGVTTSCSGSEKVISGGCKDTLVNSLLYENHPTDQGWYCVTYNSESHAVTAYANCCT